MQRRAALAHAPIPDLTISQDIRINDEIAHGIAKASEAFGKLKGRFWKKINKRSINLIYNSCANKLYTTVQAVVLTALLYSCETWIT